MYRTYTYILCSFILLYMCTGVIGGDIHLMVHRNGTHHLYDESLNIEYKEGELVTIVCSTTTNTISDDGEYPLLTWIDGGKETKPMVESVPFRKVLTRSDDGTALVCRAMSEGLGKTWTISARFYLKRNDTIKIFLITVGAVIVAAILGIVIYGIYERLRRKQAEERDTPLKEQQVVYSEVDKTKKGPLDAEYVEIGIDNRGCQMEKTDEFAANFDSPESNHYRHLTAVKCDSPEIEIVRSEKGENNENNISVLGTTTGSSDC